MKRLFIIGLMALYIIVVFAKSNPAIIKVSPELNTDAGIGAKHKVCSGDSTKTADFGVSKYDQCIKMYEFNVAMEKYFRDNLEKFVNDSKKLKMETPKTTSWKADYMLFCGLYPMIDELKSESGWYRRHDEAWYKSRWQKAMAKGVYYMQLNCKLINIDTNRIIYITEDKTKVLTDNGLLSAKDLILYGKRLIERGFPKSSDLEKWVENNIKFNNAEFQYTYDNENNKYANGKETGILKITSLTPGFLSRHALTEFTLTAKQGKFTKDMSQSTTFTDTDYRKKNGISFAYQTYDCQDEKNNKYFETFTLKTTEQLTEKKEAFIKDFQVHFECLKPYYTVTTSERTTTTVKPIENYRGINKDLKSYEEDKDTYYVYIDAKNAKIVQYHVDAKSTRKLHREAYKLNMQSCQYEIETKDKLIKNMGGSDILKSEDAGWGFEDDTKIYVNLPSSQKDLSFTWARLRENGHYNKTAKYKKRYLN